MVHPQAAAPVLGAPREAMVVTDRLPMRECRKSAERAHTTCCRTALRPYLTCPPCSRGRVAASTASQQHVAACLGTRCTSRAAHPKLQPYPELESPLPRPQTCVGTLMPPKCQPFPRVFRVAPTFSPLQLPVHLRAAPGALRQVVRPHGLRLAGRAGLEGVGGGGRAEERSRGAKEGC